MSSELAKSPAQVVFGALIHSWRHPQRRAAFYALAKATILIAALWEYVWLWHLKFYSRHFADVPISIAWSLLTVIACITIGQIGCSAVLKFRSARLQKAHAHVSRRLTSMLAEYISNGDFEEELLRFAQHSTKAFEDCITIALLSTRGAAHERLRELPAMSILRDRWIDKLHKREEQDRRYAVEHLALLRDPEATIALEYALEDQSQGVVAGAIRGLLRIPDYSDREALIRSLPARPLLVRVLTAGESPEEIATGPNHHQALSLCGARTVADDALTLVLRHQELQMRALAVEEAVKLRRKDTARLSCSVLAASGVEGRELLRAMSAAGTGGEAPAEALGGLLAAAARGGRT